jgi:5-formyltetrahydrofolate cyclo-ligase
MFSLDDLKRRARAAAMRRRGDCDPACAGRLAFHLLRDLPPPPHAVVSGFWPMGDEVDLRPLLTSLHARGHTICLPETPRRGNPLIFRQWHPGAKLIVGRFGTLHPTGPLLTPDWLLVPLLGFDRTGHRLGYGGGYYDRTLAALPQAIAVGCAYAAQELDEVPAGEYDVRLHAVVTEAGVIRCKDF